MHTFDLLLIYTNKLLFKQYFMIYKKKGQFLQNTWFPLKDCHMHIQYWYSTWQYNTVLNTLRSMWLYPMIKSHKEKRTEAQTIMFNISVLDLLLTEIFYFLIFLHQNLMFNFLRRYLSDLRTPGDPAWQCINAQHSWILKLMLNCRNEFISGQKGMF